MPRLQRLSPCLFLVLLAVGFDVRAQIQILDVQGGQIRVETVASGFVHPWSIGVLPNGDLLVGEVTGRILLVRDGTRLAAPVWVSPTSPDTGDALKMLAVHPRFAENRLVYMSYPKHGERGNTLAVARGRMDNDKLVDVEDILVADAWETSGNMGGRLYFGPDETLYIAVGDRDRLCCTGSEDNSLRLKAQSLANHVGKVLRVNDDGSVPADNPFVGRADAKPEIFTYGHRNTYGFSFHPETGELWQAEIGPMGGDEVNILQPGHNYGWPVVSTGRNYTGTLVSDSPWSQPGMDNPRIHWVPSISPSSLMFYTGNAFPDWKNNLFVGALTTRQLQRISFGQPSQAERREGVLAQLGLRIRDIAEDPDGNIYVATESSFGGTSNDGTVLKLMPMISKLTGESR